MKSRLFARMFLAAFLIACATAWAQNAPPQTPEGSGQMQSGAGTEQNTTPGGMPGMKSGGQNMQQMQAMRQQMQQDLTKMHQLLDQMKSQMNSVDQKDRAMFQANMEMWQMMVNHMDQMSQHMQGMMGRGDRMHPRRGTGPGTGTQATPPSQTPPQR